MIEFDIWWNSAAADSFRAKNEDMDGEQVRPVWDAAVRAALAAQPADAQAPAPAHQVPPGWVFETLAEPLDGHMRIQDPSGRYVYVGADCLDTTERMLFDLAKTFSQAPAVQDGLSPSQEPKYTVNGHAIVNRASGEAIPADEPVFIFRGRDAHAMYALRDYLSRLPLGTSHRKAVEQRVMDFFDFKATHPERMKEPDTAFDVPVQGSQP